MLSTSPPPAGSPGPGDAGEGARPVWVAISRNVERTRRRLDTLEGLVRDLGEKLTALGDRPTAPSPAPGGHATAGATGGMRSWLRGGDPERAAADLAGLNSWVERVYLAFPDSSLPSCWMWHPDVVEELWWLYQSHIDAYHPETGSWMRVGDWHDRQRPKVVWRFHKSVAQCAPARHHQSYMLSPRRRPEPAPAAVAVVAAWMAEGRREPAPLPPEDPPPPPRPPQPQLLQRGR